MSCGGRGARSRAKHSTVMATHLAPQDLGNGRKSSGYFASDLTLEQIKTLWATQSFPERDQSQDGKYR